MTTTIKSNSDGLSGAIQVNGNDVVKFDQSGITQGAPFGFRNKLINGNFAINQRGVSIAAAANGAYGPDRWKKVDASNMTQIVEAGNFRPSTQYVLSGTGVTTQVITSPASGNWTLPNIPITATNIQLEEGTIATPFEHRPIGLELSLCQRYYIRPNFPAHYAGTAGAGQYAGSTLVYSLPVTMRVAPTLNVLTASGINITSVSTQATPYALYAQALTIAAGYGYMLVTFVSADAEL